MTQSIEYGEIYRVLYQSQSVAIINCYQLYGITVSKIMQQL